MQIYPRHYRLHSNSDSCLQFCVLSLPPLSMARPNPVMTPDSYILSLTCEVYLPFAATRGKQAEIDRICVKGGPDENPASERQKWMTLICIFSLFTIMNMQDSFRHSKYRISIFFPTVSTLFQDTAVSFGACWILLKWTASKVEMSCVE